MHDCMNQQGIIAVFFWVVFVLITFFIFMNIFVAVIYENFQAITSGDSNSEVLSLKRRDIKNFLHTWSIFDPSGDLYIPAVAFPRFLRTLPQPLGYKEIDLEPSKLGKIIFCLNIRVHRGRVYFPEVMWAIFHSLIGNNEEKVHKCESILTIMRVLKTKYEGLGKRVTPDRLCGNKFSKRMITVAKYLNAMRILWWWKMKQEERNRLTEEAHARGEVYEPPHVIRERERRNR